MSWSPNGLDGVFFITITTLIIGFLGLSVRLCLKSKCGKVNCCFGFLQVERNVDLETNEEIRELELRDNNTDKQNNLEV
jgi:hypothetical protein